MTPEHRTSTRTRTATALTTGLLTTLITLAFHHAGHLTSLLLTLTAALSAITITLALTAVFAPNTSTRQAATRTLDLLLRLVPWYTHPEADPQTPSDHRPESLCDERN
ncbi:hypothetical protein [Streptomyces echinatus]|uniref:hypothetical protein n=1 Tax=Streptomyces echinatus TaxID=67293 RepID=UPI0037B9103E